MNSAFIILVLSVLPSPVKADGGPITTPYLWKLLKEGQQQLLDEGAFFSRPYGVITDSVFKKASPEMVKALQSVKKIFDPNNVLNPGTLCFKEVPK